MPIVAKSNENESSKHASEHNYPIKHERIKQMRVEMPRNANREQMAQKWCFTVSADFYTKSFAPICPNAA